MYKQLERFNLNITYIDILKCCQCEIYLQGEPSRDRNIYLLIINCASVTIWIMLVKLSQIKVWIVSYQTKLSCHPFGWGTKNFLFLHVAHNQHKNVPLSVDPQVCQCHNFSSMICQKEKEKPLKSKHFFIPAIPHSKTLSAFLSFSFCGSGDFFVPLLPLWFDKLFRLKTNLFGSY